MQLSLNCPTKNVTLHENLGRHICTIPHVLVAQYGHRRICCRFGQCNTSLGWRFVSKGKGISQKVSHRSPILSTKMLFSRWSRQFGPICRFRTFVLHFSKSVSLSKKQNAYILFELLSVEIDVLASILLYGANPATKCLLSSLADTVSTVISCTSVLTIQGRVSWICLQN